MQQGDRLRAVNGEAVENLNNLRNALAKVTQPGDLLTLTLERKGKKMEVKLKVESAPLPKK